MSSFEIFSQNFRACLQTPEINLLMRFHSKPKDGYIQFQGILLEDNLSVIQHISLI